MDIVRVLLSWVAGVHSEEKSCQWIHYSKLVTLAQWIPTCTQHRHTHTQNTSISCIHYWRHHACRHRCTLNVHVLLILKGFPDFDETFVCVVSIWNSRTLGATGKSPRCFLTIPPTPQRDGNHSQRLLPRISSIFKLQTHAHVLVRITVLRYLKVNNSLQADDTIHAPSNSTTAAGGCFYKNLSQRSCFRHVLFFKSWAMICVQVWRWRCLNLCLTAMDDLQWFVPPWHRTRTVHISERLCTVLFQYTVVFLHVFEKCMMYDTIFQARIRQFLSGDPPSNQHHVVSQQVWPGLCSRSGPGYFPFFRRQLVGGFTSPSRWRWLINMLKKVILCTKSPICILYTSDLL